MSLYDLHRESSSLLRRELNQIGFNLGVEGDLERVLYPHFLSHPIGIGQSLTIPFLVVSLGLMSPTFLDLHESTNFDRTSTSVFSFYRFTNMTPRHETQIKGR